MIYQIQTKFRDEPRARGGLIRVREFTMKDAYSFHTTQADLEAYYERCRKAYERIFARAGIPGVVSVKSDSGMMGGKVAHEFMLLTEAGEDTLAVCSECCYRSNIEVAEVKWQMTNNDINSPRRTPHSTLKQVSTPNMKTIEEISAFFGMKPEQTCKAVVYNKIKDNAPVIVFIRGDLEVNEIKLRNFLHEEIYPSGETPAGVTAGFIGPVKLKTKAAALFDASLRGERNLICGANKKDYHMTGFTPERDMPGAEYYDFAKTYEGAVCPECGKPAITLRKGIEVGNIFQLGTKYAVAMGMQYLDKDGVLQHPIMGCYGIGVGRLAASVCEAKRDAYGPVWPISIAPWQVHICALRNDNEKVAAAANALYEELANLGIEVIFDDRPVSAGVMFSDADLLGVPVRAVVSPKTCERGVIEISYRDKSWAGEAGIGVAAELICGKVGTLLEEFK